MSPALRAPALMMTAALLMLLAAGCSTPLASLRPDPVAPARIPPLPEAARQPPAPALCSPSCSKGLSTLLESWQKLLTAPASPVTPVVPMSTR